MQARLVLALTACLGAGTAAAENSLPPPAILAVLGSPDRPAADKARDALRHPGELVVFAGLKTGDQVADVMPGTGYFTRIFSKVVGPQGHVYAIVPAELARVAPKIPDAMKLLSASPAFPNVSMLLQPTAAIATPARIDVAWTSDNYHDLYGFFGAPQAAALDAAVFRALKPGGVFVVIDHVGKPGSLPTKLHRIDPAVVKAQLLAAGFTLEAESQILHNPADPHDMIVFAPEIRGHTDQFVFRFRKPKS
jgi:predicted methyltransferase